MNRPEDAKAQAREDRTVYRALRILESRGPVLNEQALVRRWCQLHLAQKDHEVFGVLFLDTRNQLIAWEELARGTLDQAAVYPREAVKAAIRHNAGAVIFAHNHPSGCATPSEADVALTRRLKDALQTVDVRVLDHFIVGGMAPPLSFAERGLT